MGSMKETLTQYTIGAVAGLAIYHWILKPEFNLPSLSKETTQKLIQENSFLRQNTNQMMQKMAMSMTTNQRSRALRTGMLSPDSDVTRRGNRYGFMENRNTLQAKPQSFGMIDGVYRHPEAKYGPGYPGYDERQRHFGDMNSIGFQQNPAKTERERRYGFASPTIPKLNPFGMM